MYFRGDSRILKNILLTSFVFFGLICCFGVVGAAVPGSYCPDIGATTSCDGSDYPCSDGIQECLEGNTWSDCSTQGDWCGSCEDECDSDPFEGDIRTYDFSSLHKYCDVNGNCPITQCNYQHVCADGDLHDGWPIGVIVGCDAECDSPDDCDSYCSAGNIYHYSGVCNILSDCSCAYETKDCDDMDDYYCDGTSVVYRDYYCDENAEGGCDYNEEFIRNCNDGEWCNGQETCSVGACVSGNPPDCNDDVSCTDDSCNEGTDSCDHNPNNAHCDNGDWCDGQETCDTLLGCQSGSAPDCNDDVSCTDDSCNEGTDSCDHNPNNAHCDNGLWCDGEEYCDSESDCQLGNPVICDDENECTDDTCDEDEDKCKYPPKSYGTSCGSFRNCPDDYCNDGPLGLFFPDDGQDYCDGFGQCVEYSCAIIDSHCCDDDSGDGVNGLLCNAECDQDEDCGDICESSLLSVNGVCDLGSSCSCSYTELTCETQCAYQGCGEQTYVCYDQNWVNPASLTEICNNGMDDDCDDLVDCDDPDCDDSTPPETNKIYGTPIFPVEVKTDNLCYKDEGNGWNCYDTLAPALNDIGYTELPTGDLIYNEKGPLLKITVSLSGLKPNLEYQLTLNGRNGNDGNMELGTNCNNPNGPKEGYVYAWECGTWTGGTGEEGFWNFDMNAMTDENGDYEETYFLAMPNGYYGIGPGVPYGFGFIVKEAADVPGGSNYPPVLMEVNGLDWYIESYTYPLWINSLTPIYLEAIDPQVDTSEECTSGVDETYYRVSLLLDNDYCLNPQLCQEASGTGDFLIYEGPFNVLQDSCHLIEYYSVDNKGTQETPRKQCIFVDNQPPVTNKTIEEVKTKWYPNAAEDDYETSYFYPEETAHCWEESEQGIECWKVTLDTVINMECYDPAPHPVGFEKLCFKVDWDGEDVTEDYCREKQEIINEEGYCCGEYNITGFKFKEQSEHNLKYYCEDMLGNREYDEEKFKVFGEMEEIELVKKWNLISVPFDPINKDPKAVFSEVQEDIDSVWSYDSENGEWSVYRPNSPETSDLEEIETGLGYWVMALEDTEFSVGGSLFSPGPGSMPGQELKEGWNLIGYYGTEPETNSAYCALFSLVDTQQGFPRGSSLWGYNAVSQEFMPLSVFSSDMETKKGYWLEIDVEDYYVPATMCVLPD